MRTPPTMKLSTRPSRENLRSTKRNNSSDAVSDILCSYQDSSHDPFGDHLSSFSGSVSGNYGRTSVSSASYH